MDSRLHVAAALMVLGMLNGRGTAVPLRHWAAPHLPVVTSDTFPPPPAALAERFAALYAAWNALPMIAQPSFAAWLKINGVHDPHIRQWLLLLYLQHHPD